MVKIYLLSSMNFFLLFSTFCYMKIKNIKISEDSHNLLKTYCNKKGLKIYKFLETLIYENCSEEKDIYGE